MAGIIKTSINLSNIPKDKIIVGKKGKYIPIAITVNDEPDQLVIKDQLLWINLRKKEKLRLLRLTLEIVRLFGRTVLFQNRSRLSKLQKQR